VPRPKKVSPFDVKRAARLAVAICLTLVPVGGGCKSEPAPAPPVVAPPSRHDALRAGLTSDARAFVVDHGDYLEDFGDASFYGLAWLSRRKDLDATEATRRDELAGRSRTLLAQELLQGDLQDKVSAALGFIEYLASRGDAASPDDVTLLDSFVDRLDTMMGVFNDYLDVDLGAQAWSIQLFGPTAVTALVGIVEAQEAYLLPSRPRASDRVVGAQKIAASIEQHAYRDLIEPDTGRTSRGYAFSSSKNELYLYPNVAMMLLEARLFAVTGDEAHRQRALSLYDAIQPLKLSDAPARYASPYAAEAVKASKRTAVSTLSSQNYLTLGLTLLFEISGQQRFVDEADRVLDGILTMRGPYCDSQVDDPAPCTKCSTGSTCQEASCVPDRCTTGLLHHFVDGRLVVPADTKPGDGYLFCSGCNLQTLYVLGTRRAAADEDF
jgi:hypothetical protein